MQTKSQVVLSEVRFIFCVHVTTPLLWHPEAGTRDRSSQGNFWFKEDNTNELCFYLAAQPFVQKYELLKYTHDICKAKMDGKYTGFSPVPSTSYSVQKSYLNTSTAPRRESKLWWSGLHKSQLQWEYLKRVIVKWQKRKTKEKKLHCRCWALFKIRVTVQ